MGRNHTSIKHRQKHSDTKQKNHSESKNNDKLSNKLWFPGGETAFKALLSARFCSVIWCHITDCDEVYNYWEPTHFLIYNKGLQTWEYSPQFALRSYTYLLYHALPVYLYHELINPSPLVIFYFIKCMLGLWCSIAEVYFFKAICREFGVHIGRICLIFQLFSAGMFISSTAYLPSSFAMYTFTMACANWWQQKYALAVFFVALGSILGWPFTAVLGLPIAFDIVFRKKLYSDFIKWCLINLIIILLPMIIIDSMYYGKLIIAPYNIIKYNVFSGGNSNLYGVEPFSFYIINGFLNFNFIWLFCLVTPLVLILCMLFVPSKNKNTLSLPYYLSLSPLYIWLMIFMVTPHKEERFLFPIYPMICLCGAITLDAIQKLIYRVWSIFRRPPNGSHYLDLTSPLAIIFVCLTCIFGLSRIFALYKYYYAPLDLFSEFNRIAKDHNLLGKAPINVCLGKDWHRYPSSFFLPNKQWNVHFIKSEFKGLLPAPFSNIDNSTMIEHQHFNDQNLEESSLYWNISDCHFLLDINFGKESKLEPIYSNQKDKWKIIKTQPFLNIEKSPKFFRSFYEPFLNHKYNVFGNFDLLKNVKLKIK